MYKYQFTFYNSEGKYKPISTIIQPINNKETITQMFLRAKYNVRTTRGWTEEELIEKYKYNRWKYRAIKENNKPVIEVTRAN